MPFLGTWFRLTCRTLFIVGLIGIGCAGPVAAQTAAIPAEEAGVRDARYPVGDVRRYRATDVPDQVAVQRACDEAAGTPHVVTLENDGNPLVFFGTVTLTARHSGLTVRGGRIRIGDTGDAAPYAPPHIFVVRDDTAVPRSISFRDLELDGNRAYFEALGGNGSIRGIWCDGQAFRPHDITVERVTARHFTLTGITLNCTAARVRGYAAEDCGTHGLNLTVLSTDPAHPDRALLEDIHAMACEGAGVDITDNDRRGTHYGAVTLDGMLAEGCGYGVKIQAHGTITVRRALIREPRLSHGIYCHNKAHGTVTLERCAVEAPAQYGFWFAHSGTYRLTHCSVTGGYGGIGANNRGASSATPTSLTVRGLLIDTPVCEWGSFAGRSVSPWATVSLEGLHCRGEAGTKGLYLGWHTELTRADLAVPAGTYGLKARTDTYLHLEAAHLHERDGKAHGLNAQPGAQAFLHHTDLDLQGTATGGAGTYLQPP